MGKIGQRKQKEKKQNENEKGEVRVRIYRFYYFFTVDLMKKGYKEDIIEIPSLSYYPYYLERR